MKLLVTMEHVRSKGAPLSYHCAKHVLLVAGMLCSTLQPSAKTADLLAHPALELEFPSWEAAVFQDLRRCYPSLPLIFAHEPHLIHRLAESLDTMSKRLLVAELLVAGSRHGFWQL